MKFNTNETEVISPELIVGYIIQRSPTDRNLFNVYAVSSNDDLLFCAASDLTFEKASAMVDVVNQEHFPVVPSPTELVTIQMENEQRIFKVVKG